MKNTFHVAHFDINMVLSTRNMFTEVRVPKSRGLIGTRFTYAPIWQACGKPSTKFPHRGLVECDFTPRFPYRISHSFFKINEFREKIKIFPGKFQFFKISGNLEPHQSSAGMFFLTKYHIHIDLQHTLNKVFFAFSYTSSIKTLSTRPMLATSSPFCAGPSLASLAIVSV